MEAGKQVLVRTLAVSTDDGLRRRPLNISSSAVPDSLPFCCFPPVNSSPCCAVTMVTAGPVFPVQAVFYLVSKRDRGRATGSPAARADPLSGIAQQKVPLDVM